MSGYYLHLEKLNGPAAAHSFKYFAIFSQSQMIGEKDENINIF